MPYESFSCFLSWRLLLTFTIWRFTPHSPKLLLGEIYVRRSPLRRFRDSKPAPYAKCTKPPEVLAHVAPEATCTYTKLIQALE